MRSLVFVLIVFFGGCSAFQGVEPLQFPITLSAGDAGDASAPPVVLKVLEEINNGAELQILASIIPQVAITSSDVAFSLTSFKDGEVRNTRRYTLAQLLPADRELSVGVEQHLVFAVQAQDATDYQLEVLWGDEARETAGGVGAAAGAPGLVLRGVRVERTPIRCEAPPCGSSVRIVGELANVGLAPIQHVVLGAGIIWIPRGAARGGLTNAGEPSDTLELTALNLQPGQSKKLRIKLSKIVPDSEQGVYEPQVQIVSYE